MTMIGNVIKDQLIITMTMVGNVIKHDVCIYYNIVAVGIATYRKCKYSFEYLSHSESDITTFKGNDGVPYHFGTCPECRPAKPPEPQT